MSKKAKTIGSTLFGIVVLVALVVLVVARQPRNVDAQVISPGFAQGGAVAGAVQGQDSAYAGTADQVILSQLPVVARVTGGQVVDKYEPGDSGTIEARKERAALVRDPQLLPTPTLAGSSPRAVPASSTGVLTPAALLSLDGLAIGCSGAGVGWVPADQGLAIGDGSNPILQTVNDCLVVYSPGGSVLYGPVSLQSFFGLAAGTYITDPRALFDWYNHRFIVIAVDTNRPYPCGGCVPAPCGSGVCYYDIAVSQSDNPAGAWWRYRLSVPSTANALPDYPRIGQDRTSFFPGTSTLPGAIYVASNLYGSGGTGAYLYEEWLVLPKNKMYQGQAFSYWYFFGQNFGGINVDSTQPANTWSPYETPRAEFFVGSKNLNFGGGQCSGGCNGLYLWSISNPFSFNVGGPNPHINGIAIATANSYQLAPNAVQSGGAALVDTLDTRVSGNATYAHGHIHAGLDAANGAGGTRSLIYKVQPFLNQEDNANCTGQYANACPTITTALIRNETILDYGGTSAAFFPTPQPDLDGNVTTVFNFVNSASFVGLAYISQRVTQTPGTFDAGDLGIYLMLGQVYYPYGRWGDYTAVAPFGVFYAAGDGGPTGNNGMGFAGMYAGNGNGFVNVWRTRIGANRFTAPTLP